MTKSPMTEASDTAEADGSHTQCGTTVARQQRSPEPLERTSGLSVDGLRGLIN